MLEQNSQYKQKSGAIYIINKHLLVTCVFIMCIVNNLIFMFFVAQYSTCIGLSLHHPPLPSLRIMESNDKYDICIHLATCPYNRSIMSFSAQLHFYSSYFR